MNSGNNVTETAESIHVQEGITRTDLEPIIQSIIDERLRLIYGEKELGKEIASSKPRYPDLPKDTGRKALSLDHWVAQYLEFQLSHHGTFENIRLILLPEDLQDSRMPQAINGMRTSRLGRFGKFSRDIVNVLLSVDLTSTGYKQFATLTFLCRFYIVEEESIMRKMVNGAIMPLNEREVKIALKRRNTSSKTTAEIVQILRVTHPSLGFEQGKKRN